MLYEVITDIGEDRGVPRASPAELGEMRERLQQMRQLLDDALRAEAPEHDFSHVVRARGMFCFLGVSTEQA